MARYLVLPTTPQDAVGEPFELDCPNDHAAWHMAGGFLRAGNADVWQGQRYVGALTMAAADKARLSRER